MIGRVHRSILGSLYPLKITLSLYTTSHFSLSKTTLHPTLHRGQIPMSKAVLRSRMMCPVSVTGNPGIFMSHACVDLTFLPSGRLTVRGFVATCLFVTSTPSITNKDGSCPRISLGMVWCDGDCIDILRLWDAVHGASCCNLCWQLLWFLAAPGCQIRHDYHYVIIVCDGDYCYVFSGVQKQSRN